MLAAANIERDPALALGPALEDPAGDGTDRGSYAADLDDRRELLAPAAAEHEGHREHERDGDRRPR